MSEITIGKAVYLGPTAVDHRDAEIERLKESESDADALREIIDKYDRDLRHKRIENENLNQEIAVLKAESLTREKHWNKLYDDQRITDAAFYSKMLLGRYAEIELHYGGVIAQLKAELSDAEKHEMAMLVQIAAEFNAASEERYQYLIDCSDKAEHFKREGDMYGWNFHQGMSAGANWADLYYQRVARKVDAIRAAKEKK